MQEPPTSLTPIPIDLRKIQHTRKALLLGVVVVALIPVLFIESYWRLHARLLCELIEGFGVAVIIASIFGRTWSTLYIGGRKKRELVTVGPYSLVRNPLYVATVAGAVGIGAQSGSLLVAALAGLIIFAVFWSVVRREEAFLRAAFPVEFAAYAKNVPRFWPRLSGWRNVERLEINPYRVGRTFLQACLFLAAIPAADIVEELQLNGWIPIYLRLP